MKYIAGEMNNPFVTPVQSGVSHAARPMLGRVQLIIATSLLIALSIIYAVVRAKLHLIFADLGVQLNGLPELLHSQYGLGLHLMWIAVPALSTRLPHGSRTAQSVAIAVALGASVTMLGFLAAFPMLDLIHEMGKST
jgi:hypothetical protein